MSIHIPSAQSLKDKRMVLRSIKDRVRNRFNVSAAELDGQDKWQVATLGFSIVSADSKFIDSSFQKLLALIESYPDLYVCEHAIEML